MHIVSKDTVFISMPISNLPLLAIYLNYDSTTGLKTFHKRCCPLKKIRRFPTEVKGLKLLAELGDELFGDEDPAQVYYEGKAIRVIELEQGIEVVVPIAFASKDVCEVERMGEDLSVVISTDIGEVRNFIPLPAIAQMMTLEKAKLLNGELHIYFIDERWKKGK